MTKNITKYTIAGVLAVLCAAGVATALPSFSGVAPDTAIVASAETSGDYEYTLLEDGTAEITKYTGSDTWLKIPSKLGGYKVTSIGEEAFTGNKTLEYVNIPDGVTSIGVSAFSGCTSLNSLHIPDSIASIGDYAFFKCTSLVSFAVPDGVTSIGEYTFYKCSSLEELTLPDSLTSIGNNAFYRCYGLLSVTIPDGVTSIDYCAFYKCTSLRTVSIPESVTDIGAAAFFDTQWLNDKKKEDPLPVINGILIDGQSASGDVIIPDTVTKIAEEAFACNDNIVSVTIPDSVTSIGDFIFSECYSLRSVSIPDSVTSIGDYTFEHCTSLEDVTIPNSVTSIGELTFMDCSSLKSITIPESVTSISHAVFRDCTSLESVTIPDSVTSIEDYAFDRCSSLASITIPDSVTSIGYGAFLWCTSLTSVSIPDSVTSLGKSVFFGCTSLTSVTIPASVTSIDEQAFGYYYDKEKSEYCKLADFKIYCYSGTAGEQYAIDNGFDYELIKETPAVTFEKGNGAVKLTWENVEGAENYCIIGFADGKWKPVATLPATENSYVIKNLKAGTNYKVAVIAKINGEWNKDVSKAIIVTPNAAQYPVVKSQVKGSQFRLGWTAVEGAQGYAVAVYQDGWKLLKATDANTFTYTSAKLEPGTYHVAVAAKINGKWDTANIKSRAVTITIE